MLSNDAPDLVTSIDDVLDQLLIDPELKAILYECLHAKDKILERDQVAYDNEINEFILQDKLKKN